VRAIFRLQEFGRFLDGSWITPEVYQYLFDALPILLCTLAFSIILPWELDYSRAVGDVLEKLEWGLLFPIVWPIKSLIRKKMTQRSAKKTQQLAEDPSTNTSTHELDNLSGIKV